ncbi:recombinase family protein [Jatrophihabitans endophyticus]|uniref:recombinase family protein n=1 Tax=Jatrophihabitans endophyticus TaxID=1206085 RepID=UPI000A027ED4|nr:recombinase family protein [Jatrophihabitans endophyticus]
MARTGRCSSSRHRRAGLARSLPDARDIADDLTTRQIELSLGGSVYDPADAIGTLLFTVLAMAAEFEGDLIRMRTREGMAVAEAWLSPRPRAGCAARSPHSAPPGSPPGPAAPRR